VFFFELGIIGLVHVHVIRAMYGGSNDWMTQMYGCCCCICSGL